MSLSSDLLVQAQFLVGKETTRPRQTSLRRAVSAAYYSLFHLLAEDATRIMLAGGDAASLRDVVRRAFQHRTMAKAAQGIAAGTPAEPWRSLLAVPSAQLQSVAAAFVQLQQARYEADYAPGRRFTRAEARALVDQAEDATAAWKAVRKAKPGSKSHSLEARVFLSALLVHDQVRR